jgi:hypothetical protein
MLARSPATAGQATFEPDEEDAEDDEDEDDPDEDDEDEAEPAFSPAFLSPLLSPLPEDLSPDEAAVSAFLLSDDPFADAAAGSELFWVARLSVR